MIFIVPSTMAALSNYTNSTAQTGGTIDVTNQNNVSWPSEEVNYINISWTNNDGYSYEYNSLRFRGTGQTGNENICFITQTFDFWLGDYSFSAGLLVNYTIEARFDFTEGICLIYGPLGLLRNQSFNATLYKGFTGFRHGGGFGTATINEYTVNYGEEEAIVESEPVILGGGNAASFVRRAEVEVIEPVEPEREIDWPPILIASAIILYIKSQLPKRRRMRRRRRR